MALPLRSPIQKKAPIATAVALCPPPGGQGPGHQLQTGKSKRKDRNKSPQQALAEFWSAFQARTPSTITSVFPRRLYTQYQLQPSSDVLGWSQYGTARSGVTTPTSMSTSTSTWSTIADPSSSPANTIGASTTNTAASYEAAAQACRAAVAAIVRECHRTNEQFTDHAFNIEDDDAKNCLRGLVRRRPAAGGEENAQEPHHTPQAVHRVGWIFEKPVFVKEEPVAADTETRSSQDAGRKKGFAASDVQQGAVGDCWWIAAVATIAHRTDLMRRICVARDEACGVYGFVFHRDGAWTPVVVDDNLYLKHADFAPEKYDSTGQRVREHRQKFQRGSEALSFARCEDASETWLPLMEKAFAKAHGDYGALAGGWYGEGVEDLTGGVSTTVLANRVLDRDRLWRELAGCDPHDDFVFGVSVMGCGCHRANHNGLAVNHCYSVLQAVETAGEDGETVRLVQIRNPWGQRSERTGFGEWHGPWSDGSKEWNAYWFAKLGHAFGDNGVFWMAYDDLLDTFGFVHRTRLFDAHWTVVQQWASVGVAWVPGYLGTRFAVDVQAPGLVVLVLSQLDSRYFRGLRGQYAFTLHFVVRSAGDAADGGAVLGVVHASNANETRSVSCEVHLPAAGRYEVVPQVRGQRNRQKWTVAAVVRETIETNPDKLRQIGRQYDEAHAKGGNVLDEDVVLETRRARRVATARAKKAWQKAAKQRLREMRYRDETLAWAHRRREEEALKKREEMRRQAQKARDEGDNEKEQKPDEESRVERKQGGGKRSDLDDVQDLAMDAFPVDLGHEPRPVLEPDFDADTDSDREEGDSDDLLSDSDNNEDSTRQNAVTAVCTEEDAGNIDSGDETLADRRGCRTGHGHGDKHGHEPCANKTEPDDSSPWNAVCVLGLRLYSKDPAATIEVVRPKKKGKPRREEEALNAS